MFDDFVIGKINRDDCSATKMNIPQIPWDEHDISSSRYSYWITLREIGTQFRVYKDTKEGESLTFMIKQGSSQKVIEDFLHQLALKNLDYKKVIHLIRDAKRTGRAEGYDAAKAELRKWLQV